MLKQHQKNYWGMIVLAGLLLFLTACGDSSSENSSEQSEERTETPSMIGSPPVQPPEPLELVIQNQNFGWTREFFYENYGDDIQKKFPHITITHIARGESTIEQSVVTGVQLDIVAAPLGSFYQMIKGFDLAFDITPFIKKHDYDLNRLDPTVVALSKQLAGGGMYDIPVSLSPAALVYNQEIFDKFGMDYPTDGMTWDEVYDLARTMTRSEGDVQYRGLYVSPQHLIIRNQLSLNLVDPLTMKASVNTDAWRSFLENFIRFYQIPGYDLTQERATLAPQKAEWDNAQTVAMWLPVSGAHLISGMERYDYATFPSFAEFPDVGPQAYPVSFYITSMSKYKDEAFQVLDYLTSDEYQMAQSRRGYYTVLNDPEIKAEFGRDSIEYAGKNIHALIPRIQAPNMIETKYTTIAGTALVTAFYDTILQKKDINTALRDASETINQKIAEDLAATQ